MAMVVRSPMRSASQPIRMPPAPVPTQTRAPASARTARSVPSASCIGFMPTTISSGEPKEIDRMPSVIQAARHEARPSTLPAASGISPTPSLIVVTVLVCSALRSHGIT